METTVLAFLKYIRKADMRLHTKRERNGELAYTLFHGMCIERQLIWPSSLVQPESSSRPTL